MPKAISTVQTNVRLPEPVRDAVEMIAARDGISLNAAIVRAIEAYINQDAA